MVDLKDKVAIVTGASSGIGAAIVKGLLDLEMKVVGLARRKEKIEKLGEGQKGKLYAFQADVTKEQDILEALHWTEETVGPLYILVNNAGVAHPQPILESDPQTWTNTINTNLLGLALFTQLAVKTMTANKTDGIILNIGSIAGHYHLGLVEGQSIYQASKFGVTGFTESVRRELARMESKIRITNICPGLVRSEMTDKYLDILHIQSEDIANSVKFIVSQPANVNISEIKIRPTGELL